MHKRYSARHVSAALMLACLGGFPAGARAQVAISPPATEILEPGNPLSLKLPVENRGAADAAIEVRYTLQANPAYVTPIVPDSVLGYDHAAGTRSTVSVDGVDKGDALMTDNSDFSGFETNWGAGYKEAIATIDLGTERDVSAVQWMAGDANWIFKADVSTSVDGKTFSPVAEAQGFDMHAKWAGPHSFPWKAPVHARYIRFRFHKDGEATNVFRLPPTVMVYDGIANDTFKAPQVGDPIASGTAKANIAAGATGEVVLNGSEKLTPGAYLLSMEFSANGRGENRISNLFVRPADTVPPEKARRFGMNGASPKPAMAEDMRRCGFGWMRFENGKWQMYMPSREVAAFDGTTAPWKVNMDEIFGKYQQVGLKVLPYIFQVPEWATTAPESVKKNRAAYPPKDNADYGEAVFQMVARYGRKQVDPSLLKTADKKSGLGMIDAVELWNEPNLNDPGWGPFVGTMPQYFEVMRAGAEGSRRADPTLPITSCGFAGIDLDVVGLLSEYKYSDGKTPLDLVDVVNVHFYSGRSEPELAGWDPNVSRNGPSAGAGGTSYPEELESLVAWRDKLKPNAEIWLTETGNDVGGPIGLTERHQAAKLPRCIMLALATGIERVFIYREAGSDPAMHAGAGLLRNDGSTRPVWLTVATMIRQLQGFEGRALRMPSDDPNVWMFLWEQDGRKLITAWTLGETKPLGIELGKASVCDAFGRTTQAQSTKELQLSYFPTYISITEPSADFAKAVEAAKAKAAARAASLKKLGELPVQLYDFGSAEHLGMLKGFGLPRKFTAVGKDSLWDDKAGFGFAAAAAGDDDRRWIQDALERDGIRVGGGNPFRMRLPAGPHTLRVRATSINEQQPMTIRVKTASGQQEQQVTQGKPVAEFTVDGGQTIDVSLGDWGVVRWMSAIPKAQ